ncbi:MAG TPA: hypothetical protein VJ649_06680 [Actinomycetes bacterium]|nr:hypothetical protein [Actinomycetes bacterium]
MRRGSRPGRGRERQRIGTNNGNSTSTTDTDGATSESKSPAADKPTERPARGEGSLRGLSGSGPSQVGVQGALRARDVSRPRADSPPAT